MRLYSTSSGMDCGTLFQLRNLLNRRNVRKDPTDDVNACEDFFMTVTEGHILAVVMEEFGMSSLEDTPSCTIFPEDSADFDPLLRRNLTMKALAKVVQRFVDISTPSTNSPGSSNDKSTIVDTVQEYAIDTLSLGLLYMEFADAIREGDGSRILRCWRYLFLIFRASRRTNYTIEAFTLLAQERFIFSPRMALQLKWSRTINTHGKPGKNIPMDLHMEHLNREVKTALHGLGSNITDHAIQRIGKCIQRTKSVLENFDQVNRVPSQSGYHTRCSSQTDISKVASQLVTSQVFKEHTGRTHYTFPKFQRNLMHAVCSSTLKQWMSEQFKKMLIMH